MVDLKDFEYKHWSQHGEDGVIQRIFGFIPPRHEKFIEIGADRFEANCLFMRNCGWSGVFFDNRVDNNYPKDFERFFFTKDNINAKFQKMYEAGTPKDLDIISIDVDGVDFYLMNELDRSWRPTLFIVEMIPQHGLEDKVIKYDPDFQWNGSEYTGASAKAWMNLMLLRNYSLVYIENTGVNMFFVKQESLPFNAFKNTNDLGTLFNQTRHKELVYGQDPLNRKFGKSSDIL
jgi:hypothetical protein